MSGELMSTREVAAYLRLKERKVYDLVAKREIPCTRVTGKWLFPKSLIDAWLMERIEGASPAPRAAPPPAIVCGSHDPLLEWALREAGSELATLFDGSLAGLERFAAGGAVACGLHLLEPERDEYNVGAVARRLGARPVVLIEWAAREQGLVIAAGNPLGITGPGDLAGRRVALRQREAGSHVLLDHLLRRAGLSADGLATRGGPLRSETEVALAVHEGRADAGLAIAAAARQLRLGFVPLWRERYDLVIGRRDYFEPAFQRLLAFARTEAFTERARELGGYEVTGLGTVRLNGP
jgi:putative molybdopterin biosynthesis protein